MRKAMRWMWLAALLAVVALTLSACGGGGDSGGGDTGTTEETGASTGAGSTELHVSAKEFAYTPSEITAPADTATTIHLANEGTVEHDITIDEADVKITAQAQQEASGEVTLAAGTYTFYCSVPGHREQGMEGMLTVE